MFCALDTRPNEEKMAQIAKKVGQEVLTKVLLNTNNCEEKADLKENLFKIETILLIIATFLGIITLLVELWSCGFFNLENIETAGRRLRLQTRPERRADEEEGEGAAILRIN